MRMPSPRPRRTRTLTCGAAAHDAASAGHAGLREQDADGGDPDHGADQRAEAVLRPAVPADQDLITLKDDQVALAKALKASGGNTGLLTQKQRGCRGAFDTYISQVTLAATDAQAATARPAITQGDQQRPARAGEGSGQQQALRLEIQS